MGLRDGAQRSHCTLFAKIQVKYYLHRRQYYRGAAGSVLYRKGTGTHKRKDYLLGAEKCDFPASAGLRTGRPGLVHNGLLKVQRLVEHCKGKVHEGLMPAVP